MQETKDATLNDCVINTMMNSLLQHAAMVTQIQANKGVDADVALQDKLKCMQLRKNHVLNTNIIHKATNLCFIYCYNNIVVSLFLFKHMNNGASR